VGIVRFPVECAGCRGGILLRLAVGHDERQPFFFVCPQCGAVTRAALVWPGGAETRLELFEGRLLTSEEGLTNVVSINPEYPSIPGASSLEEPEGSAFLMFSRLLGMERLLGFQSATGQARALVAQEWGGLQRLTTYYLNRDWGHFDPAVAELLPDTDLNFAAEWNRDHVLHFLYDVLLVPFVALDTEPLYVEMKREWNGVWSEKGSHFPEMVRFAKSEVATQHFRDVQRDLFGHIGRYIGLLSALMPGLLCNMLPLEHQPKVDHELRLFRDDYELLRDLYIQVFETCHKALRWVIGAANTDQSGDPNLFSPEVSGASKRDAPKSLDAFDGETSAKKRRLLAAVSGWDKRWDVLFDRKMRNDIGHASAHHDFATGLILRTAGPPIAYTRFVARTQRLVHPLLASLGALKLVRIYSFAGG